VEAEALVEREPRRVIATMVHEGTDTAVPARAATILAMKTCTPSGPDVHGKRCRTTSL
jgi:hypothetical protein